MSFTCTQCRKLTDHVKSDYRKRDQSGKWIIIIRADEKLCHSCAKKRGARTIKKILTSKKP